MDWNGEGGAIVGLVCCEGRGRFTMTLEVGVLVEGTPSENEARKP